MHIQHTSQRCIERVQNSHSSRQIKAVENNIYTYPYICIVEGIQNYDVLVMFYMNTSTTYFNFSTSQNGCHI